MNIGRDGNNREFYNDTYLEYNKNQSKSLKKNNLNKGKIYKRELNLNDLNNLNLNNNTLEEKEFENKTFFSTELNMIGKKKNSQIK